MVSTWRHWMNIKVMSNLAEIEERIWKAVVAAPIQSQQLAYQGIYIQLLTCWVNIKNVKTINLQWNGKCEVDINHIQENWTFSLSCVKRQRATSRGAMKLKLYLYLSSHQIKKRSRVFFLLLLYSLHEKLDWRAFNRYVAETKWNYF